MSSRHRSLRYYARGLRNAPSSLGLLLVTVAPPEIQQGPTCDARPPSVQERDWLTRFGNEALVVSYLPEEVRGKLTGVCLW